MGNNGKRFRYSMDPLLKVRRWDADIAKAEEIRALHDVNERARETREIGESIAGVEASIRETYQGGAINAQWCISLSRFLECRRQDFSGKQDELRKAENAHEQVRYKLHTAKQGVLTLEKHREGKRAEHELDAQREEQKSADDLWLQRLQHVDKTR